MGGVAATFFDDIMHGLAADFLCTLELSLSEVPSRKGTSFVDYVGQHIGAVDGQPSPWLGNRMFPEGIPKNSGGLLESLRIGKGIRTLASLINDYGLKPLGPHDCTHASTTGSSTGAIVHVGRLN